MNKISMLMNVSLGHFDFHFPYLTSPEVFLHPSCYPPNNFRNENSSKLFLELAVEHHNFSN
jgi:hypothetical protein